MAYTNFVNRFIEIWLLEDKSFKKRVGSARKLFLSEHFWNMIGTFFFWFFVNHEISICFFSTMKSEFRSFWPWNQHLARRDKAVPNKKKNYSMNGYKNLVDNNINYWKLHKIKYFPWKFIWNLDIRFFWKNAIKNMFLRF